MALNSVTYSCTALQGTGKAGVLPKTPDGYRQVILGALNVYNSAGQRYVFEEAKALFEDSGQLQRRVNRGTLRAELGHPKFLPGMTKEQFVQRILTIYEENVCAHIRKVTVQTDGFFGDDGTPCIGILGEVKGSGPHAGVVEASLDNPSENSCWSIRAFTDDYRDRGQVNRVLRNIVTWDFVNEPGISLAQKWKSPSLESLVEVPLSRGQIERGVNDMPVGVSMESARMTADELFTAMGWGHEAFAGTKKPGYIGW